MPPPRVPANPFRYFKTSPEVIRLAVLLYARFPLSLRNVEDMLAERAWTSAIRRCANQT
jgi:putative transposase